MQRRSAVPVACRGDIIPGVKSEEDRVVGGRSREGGERCRKRFRSELGGAAATHHLVFVVAIHRAECRECRIGETVAVEMGDSLSPCLVKPGEGDADESFVIMPMRLE